MARESFNTSSATAELSDVEKDILKAREMQKLRRQEPPVSVSEKYSDPRYKKAQMHAPDGYVLTKSTNPKAWLKEHGEKRPTHVPFYGDPADHAIYIEKGYEPAVHKGEQVTDGGQPLYFIPLDIYSKKQNAEVMESKNRIMDLNSSQKSDGVVELKRPDDT